MGKERLCCDIHPSSLLLTGGERVARAEKRHLGSVDYIKAIAIVAVVLTHAGLHVGNPALTAFEKIIRQSWVDFQVPSFFLVAGFLYHRASAISWGEVGRRLQRILVPYLVASGLVIALGYSGSREIQDILFDLATGDALGIYYFVFALCSCIPFIWLFSRLPTAALWAVLVALLAYSWLMSFGYWPRPTTTWFWTVRDLFFTFFLGYFLTGWLMARHLDSFRSLFVSIENWIWPPILAGASVYVTFKVQAMWADSSAGRAFSFYRIGYTLGVAGLIVIFTHRLRVPRVVRFLSEASLTLYLYHRLFQFEFLPFTFDWSPLARIVAMLVVGLLGASLIAVLGRKLLGRHSRLLLGY